MDGLGVVELEARHVLADAEGEGSGLGEGEGDNAQADAETEAVADAAVHTPYADWQPTPQC